MIRPNNRSLIRHYRHRSSAFRLFFGKTLDRQGIEDIHKLRVTVKKLRAIWAFMETATRETFLIKEYQTLMAPLFETAGRVREVQVNRVLAGKNPPRYLMSYIEYLGKTEIITKEILVNTMRSFDMRQASRLDKALVKQMEMLSEEKAITSALHYVCEKTEKVRMLKKELPDDRILHKIRINLKAVAEMLSVIYDMDPATGLTVRRDGIRLLNRKTGTWHDYVVFLSSLRDFAGRSGNSREKYFLNRMISRIGDQQLRRQEAVHAMLDKFIVLPEITL